MIVRELPDERNVMGQLLNPPEMYVTYYDEKQMQVRVEPISFGAALVLAPLDHKDVCEKLNAVREAEWAEWQARQKAERNARDETATGN